MKRVLAGAAVCLSVAVGVGGCAGTSTTTTRNQGFNPRAAKPGDVLSLTDAKFVDSGTQVVVRGLLYRSDGNVVLCNALDSANPPHPLGDTLTVIGASFDGRSGVTTVDGVTWTTDLQTVSGTMQGLILVVG